jgi:hypothetical protein
LSVFGMESTYACATAIVRRILTCELARLAVDRVPGCNPVSNETV